MALDLIAKNREYVCDPELLRLRAMLGLRAAVRTREECRQDLERALARARLQGSRMFELRVAASLDEVDASDESRQRVQQLRSSFNEGLDLPELG